MPQSGDPTRKKKKGPAPAHQNKYAFKHNPKSKKTAAILASPIEHCCQRCFDKIEWRKKYRKYKPLTQPSTCNICLQRNITAAYHTVCDTCSIQSEKAVAFVKSWESQCEISNKETDPQNLNPTEFSNSCSISGSLQSETIDGDSTTIEHQKQDQVQYRRVCSICFKAPALPSSDDDCDNGDENAMRKKLRLREIKTLQRQREREAKEKRRQRRKEANEEEGIQDKDDNESNSSDFDSLDADDTDDDDEDGDPFLKAVGGKDKLLTGEAFQRMLLKQQEQSS